MADIGPHSRRQYLTNTRPRKCLTDHVPLPQLCAAALVTVLFLFVYELKQTWSLSTVVPEGGTVTAAQLEEFPGDLRRLGGGGDSSRGNSSDDHDRGEGSTSFDFRPHPSLSVQARVDMKPERGGGGRHKGGGGGGGDNNQMSGMSFTVTATLNNDGGSVQ